MQSFEVEFYDRFGLMLYSGEYAPKAFEATDWQAAKAFTDATLAEWGGIYPRAKTVTARGLEPGRLFNSTYEARNPHYDESRDIFGVTLAHDPARPWFPQDRES